MRKLIPKTAAQNKAAAKLLVSMTGKASSAKTANSDEPVFTYIASLPEPQRRIAERIDALAAKTVPGLQRGVKWGWPTTVRAEAGASPPALSLVT